MRLNKGGWFIALLFLGGGIFFWVTQPGLGLGQIWVAMAVFLILLYLIFGIKSRLAEGKASSGLPPGMPQGLGAPQNPGAGFGDMSGYTTTSMTVGGTQVNVPMAAAQASEAGAAIMAALKAHGIDPSSGTVDLRSLPGARAAVMKALSEHGLDLAHQVAMASPAVPIQPTQEPVERMSKLKQLRDTGLISNEEYEAQKKRILDQL